ncbi:MAG: hypothetical protein KF681_18280 [Bdellovibrionaceae bacterium]|nr:hypothetical protein [Pseudobdellovibrionaceae bacterium]
MPRFKVAKTFLYTDQATGRVLMSKRSEEADFFLPLDGVQTWALQGPAVPPVKKFETTYSFEQGLKAAPAPQGAEAARLELLRKRCEVGIYIDTGLVFARQEMEHVFAPGAVRRFPLPSGLFKRYEAFMAGEKRLLLAKIRAFRADFFAKLNVLQSVKELDDYHTDLRFNLSIGVYSATNRERKKIGHPKV